MSTFVVPVVTVRAIEPIVGADVIELAVVGEYRSVVGKGTYQPGSRAVYLPEAAILPEWLLKKMNFWNEEAQKGTLSGPKGDRVKARKIRGCLSQGILLSLETNNVG